MTFIAHPSLSHRYFRALYTITPSSGNGEPPHVTSVLQEEYRPLQPHLAHITTSQSSGANFGAGHA